MTENKKKILVIAAAIAVCLALAVGISLRFGGHGSVPISVASDPIQATKEPVVSIQNTVRPDDTNPVINITPAIESTDPSAGAINTGTEQTIQPDPVKPDEPKKPTVSTTPPLPDDHTAEDVPHEERNAETPPSYEPEQITVTPTPQPNTQGGYDQGGTYVPGFGYIATSGAGTATQDNTIYENGNKVGIMD